MAIRAVRSVALLTAFLALQPSAAAQPERTHEYPLMLDPHLRAEAATVDITTAARLLLRAEDRLLVDLEPANHAAPLAVVERLTAGALIDLPIASLELTLPHEILGHGARTREFDGVAIVHLVPPPPYDFRGAKEDYVASAYRRPITPDEATIVALAGQRVQALQQRHLAFVEFRADELRRGDAVLYAGNVALEVGQMLVAHDVDLAASAQRVRPAVYRKPYLIGLPFELLDPMLLYSLYVGGYRYLVRGERAAPFPEAHFGRWRVSATSRIVPVPWGVEHHLDLLLGSRAPGLHTIGEAPSHILGAAAYVRLVVVQRGWFFGVRLGGKTAGLLDEHAIGAGGETLLLGGVSL